MSSNRLSIFRNLVRKGSENQRQSVKTKKWWSLAKCVSWQNMKKRFFKISWYWKSYQVRFFWQKSSNKKSNGTLLNSAYKPQMCTSIQYWRQKMGRKVTSCLWVSSRECLSSPCGAPLDFSMPVLQLSPSVGPLRLWSQLRLCIVTQWWWTSIDWQSVKSNYAG